MSKEIDSVNSPVSSSTIICDYNKIWYKGSSYENSVLVRTDSLQSILC